MKELCPLLGMQGFFAAHFQNGCKHSQYYVCASMLDLLNQILLCVCLDVGSSKPIAQQLTNTRQDVPLLLVLLKFQLQSCIHTTTVTQT